MMFTMVVHAILSDPWLILAGKVAVALAGGIGLVAVASPRSFAWLADAGGRWIETAPLFQRIDRPFYVDVPLMVYSRLFGLAVLIGAALIVWLTPAQAAWASAAWIVAGGLALVAAIAVVSPTCFRRMAEAGNTWIDMSWLAAALDYRIDIDRFAIRYSRTFGVLVLASLALIAALVYW